jgi:hypothetical protein
MEEQHIKQQTLHMAREQQEELCKILYLYLYHVLLREVMLLPVEPDRWKVAVLWWCWCWYECRCKLRRRGRKR